MMFKLSTPVLILIAATAAIAQADLVIKKRSTRNIPGMDSLPGGAMTAAMQKQLRDAASSTTTVYVKGSSMRIDTTGKSMTMTGRMEDRTLSTILQCDKRRTVTFDSKSRKFRETVAPATASPVSPGSRAKRKGTMTIKVADTGERSEMFGLQARRMTKSIVITPGESSCIPAARIEIDGWYLDLPQLSCPIGMEQPDELGGADCAADLNVRVEGSSPLLALKEIKRITTGQISITIEDSLIDVLRASLADSLFEPPPGYSVAR